MNLILLFSIGHDDPSERGRLLRADEVRRVPVVFVAQVLDDLELRPRPRSDSVCQHPLHVPTRGWPCWATAARPKRPRPSAAHDTPASRIAPPRGVRCTAGSNIPAFDFSRDASDRTDSDGAPVHGQQPCERFNGTHDGRTRGALPVGQAYRNRNKSKGRHGQCIGVVAG